MERRVLLAVTLSFLVLVLYQRWIGPPPAVETVPDTPIAEVASGPADPVSAPAPAPAVGTPGVPPRPGDPGGRPAGGAVSEAPEAVPLVADDRPRFIVVESDFILAEFDNQGAELVSWKLKQYADEAGDPVELTLPAVASGRTRPFTLRVPGNPDLTARLDAALFRPSVDHLRLGADPGSLAFEYEDSSGLRVRKAFRFQPSPDQPYVVEFDATVTTAAGVETTTTAWGPGLGGVRASASRLVFQQMPGAVLYGRPLQDGLAEERDVYRASPGDVPERPSYEGQLDFAGVVAVDKATRAPGSGGRYGRQGAPTGRIAPRPAERSPPQRV